MTLHLVAVDTNGRERARMIVHKVRRVVAGCRQTVWHIGTTHRTDTGTLEYMCDLPIGTSRFLLPDAHRDGATWQIA